ncbi:MAG: DUF3343 domain-containing protein [Heliobacteriaceae bacterium]|nr:DUF3343 domain-containing protein [Heliobacteriaceae bacterium]MDD4588521.1 DUF3343 domain-containing protein [Heliobacteriaceae bacterium]
MLDWYVLFPNHNEGLALCARLKRIAVPYTIAPTPREADAGCGISLIVAEKDLGSIRQTIAQNGITILKIEQFANRRHARRGPP